MEGEATNRAQDAGLRYVCDRQTAGLRRRRCGKGFAYYDTKGELIERSCNRRKWIESLAVPPAWQQVWIAPSRNCHILACGRDDAGRKQYIYHPRWEAHRRHTVFTRMLDFGRALPRLRQQVRDELSREALDRNRVIAAVVRLMDLSLIRVGGNGSTAEEPAYGATTLNHDHLVDDGDQVMLCFRGKGGKEIEVLLNDPRLLSVIHECQDLPGQRLFRYLDADDNACTVDSQDINDYLEMTMGRRFTAKDFRTWGGSSRFAATACRLQEKEPQVEPTEIIRLASQDAADSLKNTTTIARDHYIHPALPDAVENGTLAKICTAVSAGRHRRAGLNLPERVVFRVVSLARARS